MSIKSEVRHAKNRTLEQLTAIRAEAKVQLHLLSMNARQRWGELETEIGDIEAHAAREGERAVEAVQQAVQELSGAVDEFMASQLSQVRGLAGRVETVMSAPARTCQVSDSMEYAAHLMWEGDCGALPVLSQDAPVGIITDRDICMATYTRGRPLSELQVGSAMSKDLFSCTSDDSVRDALKVMGDKRVRRLAVLGPTGNLVGMVALADIARWARSMTNPLVDAALVDALASISALAPHKTAAAAE